MKPFAAICALSLFLTGCASIQPHQDSFASLHTLIQQTLANTSDCGAIITNQATGRLYFEINARPRGLAISVSELPFLTQKEWDKRFASSTSLMSQFMDLANTNHPLDAKTAQEVTAITNGFGFNDLPEWHYQKIGVDVTVQEVDVIYPDYETDFAQAQRRYQAIVNLLKPYHRWPVFYDSEKGPDHLFLSRIPQTLDFYTNRIPSWNCDLCYPWAKINSAKIKELGNAEGFRVLEVHLSVTDTYYTDTRMILQEVQPDRFLPVYVQDYNRYNRWPTETTFAREKGKIILSTSMDYAGNGCFRNQFKITLSSNRDPVVVERFTKY